MVAYVALETDREETQTPRRVALFIRSHHSSWKNIQEQRGYMTIMLNIQRL
jgi:hypothetical protein